MPLGQQTARGHLYDDALNSCTRENGMNTAGNRKDNGTDTDMTRTCMWHRLTERSCELRSDQAPGTATPRH